jgi:uncharacterized membrane protein YqiK
MFDHLISMDRTLLIHIALYAGGAIAALLLFLLLSGMQIIPNNRVGIVEKLWSLQGQVREGRLMVLAGETGYQASLLRGGIYFGFWRWQYRIHKVPLTVIPQGKIGYVFARDGEPLKPEQTLARVVPCDNFQDARAFLTGEGNPSGLCGQRGRQRAILREGVYAINLALFVVVSEDTIYRLALDNRNESRTVDQWRQELLACDGFDPVVVGVDRRRERKETAETAEDDTIGIVTVHDGPSVEPGEIIAPAVGADPSDPNYHSNYQDVEAFLRAGGRRGLQYAPLTDGTYFINRWFATVELIPKTIVPIGFVGVVVSYYGKQGQDLSGQAFRHGERVAEGSRGVLTKTLCPGKYPFNTFAGRVHLVPTTNFVLHWITGRTEETHRYDETLKSIDLVTADAYEPVLPLSVVVHLDYEKAPSVVQRFGDIKKLITQTLDPMLSAYFRDIAHKKNMLELLHDRDLIQQEARSELKHRFAEFDIELVDVLIGKPETVEKTGEIETLLQQLRLRQLSREQIQTFEQQRQAAEKLQTLKMAQAQAEKQTELTNSHMEIEIAANRAEAELSQARRRADQTIVTAEADARRQGVRAEAEAKRQVLAAEAEAKRQLMVSEAESKARALLGEGEAKKITAEGEAQADVLRQKVASYGDPKLYALSLVTQHLAQSQQPLVPQHLFVTGGKDGTSGSSLLSTLLTLLVADRTGFAASSPVNSTADSMTPVAVTKDGNGQS